MADTDIRSPQSGLEQQLARLAGESVTPRKPQSAAEQWLEKIYENGGGGGGGGDLEPLTIAVSGYNAPSEVEYDGSEEKTASFVQAFSYEEGFSMIGQFLTSAATLTEADIIAQGFEPQSLRAISKTVDGHMIVSVKEYFSGASPITSTLILSMGSQQAGGYTVNSYIIEDENLRYESWMDGSTVKVLATRKNANMTLVDLGHIEPQATTDAVLVNVAAAAPGSNAHVVNKKYVDDAIAQAITAVENGSY